MEKPTAVEWLMTELSMGLKITIANKLQKAKAMEKQQIMDAHEQAYIKMNLSFSAADRAEQFYEETYKK